MYDIYPVNGHYEGYQDGEFVCSGDTYTEVENEMEVEDINA